MSPTVLLVLKHAVLLVICLVGDKLLQIIQKPPLLKAAVDNVAHALIGLIATEIVVHQFRDQLGRNELWLLIGFGFGLSSWIDLDHFIEARSFHIHVGIEFGNYVLLGGRFYKQNFSFLLGRHQSDASSIPTQFGYISGAPRCNRSAG